MRFIDVDSTSGGTAAAAWLATVTRRLQVRVRRRGMREFEPPVTLSSFARDGIAGGVAVAAGPRGEVAVLWAARASIHARIRRAGARRLGPALRVGPADTLATIAPVFTADGRLSVIWQSADGGEEQNRPARVRVAAQRPSELGRSSPGLCSVKPGIEPCSHGAASTRPRRRAPGSPSARSLDGRRTLVSTGSRKFVQAAGVRRPR